MKNNSVKLTTTAIFLALAILLSIVENSLPPLIPFMPYAKVGIANIVILTSILLLGKGEAYLIVVMRCVINAIYQGNISAFAFSFTAGTVSYIVSVALLSLKAFSLVGISSISGITHNFVQVAVASLFTGSAAVFAYLPYLTLIGGAVGAFIGAISHYIIKKYPIETLNGSADAKKKNNADNKTDVNDTSDPA